MTLLPRKSTKYTSRMGLNFNDLLAKAGVNASAYDKVRLGSGVVGRSSAVAFMAMVGFSVIAYSLRDPFYLIVLAAIMAVVFGGYFLGILRFANNNPDLALLEGAELVQWRQIEMAAKDPKLINQNSSAPQQIGRGGDGE
jgi:hypothetical protein